MLKGLGAYLKMVSNLRQRVATMKGMASTWGERTGEREETGGTSDNDVGSVKWSEES